VIDLMAALKASLAKGTGGARTQAEPDEESASAPEPRRAARKSADQPAEPKRARTKRS